MTNLPDVTSSVGTAPHWREWLLSKGGPPAVRYADKPAIAPTLRYSFWREWRAFIVTLLAGAAVMGWIVAAYSQAFPILKIIAVHEESGRRIVGAVEGFGDECPKWRDRIGAALQNAGFKVERQSCEDD